MNRLDIPKNPCYISNEQKIEETIANVLREIKEMGESYLDWGRLSEEYKNCENASMAYEVAKRFIDANFYVYFQKMGKGISRVAEGTPICVRIYTKPKYENAYLERMY